MTRDRPARLRLKSNTRLSRSMRRQIYRTPPPKPGTSRRLSKVGGLVAALGTLLGVVFGGIGGAVYGAQEAEQTARNAYFREQTMAIFVDYLAAADTAYSELLPYLPRGANSIDEIRATPTPSEAELEDMDDAINDLATAYSRLNFFVGKEDHDSADFHALAIRNTLSAGRIAVEAVAECKMGVSDACSAAVGDAWIDFAAQRTLFVSSATEEARQVL